jgi:hypothetical protein
MASWSAMPAFLILHRHTLSEKQASECPPHREGSFAWESITLPAIALPVKVKTHAKISKGSAFHGLNLIT